MGVEEAIDWNGLTTAEATLPGAWYRDPAHHARELEQIWYRNWIYLCRSGALAEPLDFRVFEIGTQQILLLRDDAGVLRAFHNTCRHRGAVLCREAQGRLQGRRITCPYHSWSYRLTGELLRTPTAGPESGFDRDALSLYGVALHEWRGLVFVNLDEAPKDFAHSIDTSLDRLDNWPIESLSVGHTLNKTVRCNWKIFLENYNECLHCPSVHPALCDIVPIYGRAIMEPRDDARWAAHAGTDDPRWRGGVKPGAATWSVDGRSTGHEFPDLTEAERQAGYLFVTGIPSFYIVAHVDYVRIVRLRPLGPDRTEILAEWLFPEAALADPRVDLANTVDFSALVMAQDADVCELNQRGLGALPHRHGVLMPEEYAIHQFHQWVRSELARPSLI
jgi:Rieske 2Fe-2S family protein